MSTLFESTAQYERDFRGPNQEWKHKKDSVTKWKYGSRPAAGCGSDFITGQATGGSEAQRTKSRPCRRWGQDPWKDHQNIVKTTRANYRSPTSQVRSKMSIGEELEANRRASDFGADPTSPAAQHMGSSDPFLYSFDRSVTPGRPLTLDVFVKAPTQRDTERLVEKEYEVVDENGQALKGRQARRNLRKSASDLKGEAVADDGFELV